MTQNETSYKKDNQSNKRDTAAFLHTSPETSLTLQNTSMKEKGIIMFKDVVLHFSCTTEYAYRSYKLTNTHNIEYVRQAYLYVS